MSDDRNRSSPPGDGPSNAAKFGPFIALGVIAAGMLGLWQWAKHSEAAKAKAVSPSIVQTSR